MPSYSVISIIVPVYNLADYLPNCIDSIYNQKIDKDLFEVIIIDDGSSDNSWEVINNYAKKYPNIVAIHQINSGVSVARNRGIETCSSTYFTFLDADDELQEDSLKRIINFLHTYQDVDVAYFRSFNNNHRNNFSSVNDWGGLFREDMIYDKMDLLKNNKFLNGGCVWGCAYKHSFIINNNLFFAQGIANNEDSIFNYRLMSKSPMIRFAGIPFYLVTEREGSASRSDSIERVNGYANNMAYARSMYYESTTELEKQIANACLYNTISAATNMYAKIGGRDWSYMYNLLGISSLKKIRVPWFPLNQRVKIALINISYRLYFKLLSRNWKN